MRILGLALMYNHLHILVVAERRKQVEQFVSVVTSIYARYHNEEYGQQGAVFHKAFGSSIKTGEKEIRSAAGYLYNNHTNKKLCDRAEEIRWNFLAYAHNEHPFSKQIVRSNSRRVFRNALKMVDSLRNQELYLGYSLLGTVFKGLNQEEKEQLVDYIIHVYSCIDYAELESLYRSYNEMIYSFNANTFNEYDIDESKEERRGDDRVYGQLAKAVLRSGKVSRLKELLTLSEDDRLRLALQLHAETNIPFSAIGKYLHLTIKFNLA